MAAERAINLLNMGFPSWPAPLDSLFVLAMNPTEVPAAHRAGGRACMQLSGMTNGPADRQRTRCVRLHRYSRGACELHKLQLVCTLVESKHAAACFIRAKNIILEQWGVRHL